jgi:O-antigen ligase/tetratricopeptide (TPR) repeat protein
MSRQNAISLFKWITYAGVYGGLLMPLMFIPVVIFPFVFSKLIFFQVLVGLTFPAYLALAWMEPKHRPPHSALFIAILAYFGALGLSVLFSVDPSRSWWGNQERMNGLFTLLHLLAWLVMAIGVLKTWTDWKRLLNYEVALSVFMAAVSLGQSVKKDLLLFTAGDRIGGLLDNPIYMGSYQLFNLAFLALLFVKTKSKAARVWYIVAALLDIWAFALTQSRGALVGLAATIGSFAIYYALFTGNKKARWGILGGAAAFFASYAVLFFFRTTSFVMENGILNRITNLNAASETRLIAWGIAWKGFLERPLTGWGLDTFFILFNLKYDPRSYEHGVYETWFDRAHNTIMDVLSMTGLFGFVTFAAIFVSLFIVIWRARKRQWIDLPTAAVFTALPIGYFLQNLFVFDHPAAFSMSYLMFAFVIAATRPGFMGGTVEAPATATVPAPTQRQAPWATFAIVQLLFVLIVWRFSVLPFQASLLVIRANQIRPLSIPASFELMKQAADIPTPYIDEQVFMLSRDLVGYATSGQLPQVPNWREMYDHTKRLTDVYLAEHPLSTNSLLTYARVLNEVGIAMPEGEQIPELTAAENQYRAAINTSPKRQQLFYSLARLYTMVGQYQAAYDAIKQAIDFNPNIGESWWYAGITQWQYMNMPEEGKKNILQAMKAKVPYTLQQARDALFAAQAAAEAGDTEILKKILPLLPRLSGGSVALYTDIARQYEKAGLLEERNTLINAIQQADPTTAPQFEALRNGTATSIYASMEVAPAPKPVEPSASAPVATTSGGGTGPRR